MAALEEESQPPSRNFSSTPPWKVGSSPSAWGTGTPTVSADTPFASPGGPGGPSSTVGGDASLPRDLATPPRDSGWQGGSPGDTPGASGKRVLPPIPSIPAMGSPIKPRRLVDSPAEDKARGHESPGPFGPMPQDAVDIPDSHSELDRPASGDAPGSPSEADSRTCSPARGEAPPDSTHPGVPASMAGEEAGGATPPGSIAGEEAQLDHSVPTSGGDTPRSIAGGDLFDSQPLDGEDSWELGQHPGVLASIPASGDTPGSIAGGDVSDSQPPDDEDSQDLGQHAGVLASIPASGEGDVFDSQPPAHTQEPHPGVPASGSTPSCIAEEDVCGSKPPHIFMSPKPKRRRMRPLPTSEDEAAARIAEQAMKRARQTRAEGHWSAAAPAAADTAAAPQSSRKRRSSATSKGLQIRKKPAAAARSKKPAAPTSSDPACHADSGANDAPALGAAPASGSPVHHADPAEAADAPASGVPAHHADAATPAPLPGVPAPPAGPAASDSPASAADPGMADSVPLDRTFPEGGCFGRFPPTNPARFKTWNLLRLHWKHEMDTAASAGRKPPQAWSKVARVWWNYMFDATAGISWASTAEEIRARAQQWRDDELSWQ